MTTLTAEPAVPSPSGPSLVARVQTAVFDASTSLKPTVIIVLLLAAGCLAGMWVDQTKTFEEHARNWTQNGWSFSFLGSLGPALEAQQLKYRLYTALEFHDVFHSWWFATLILLLALNLIGCSIDRLPRIWLDIMHFDPVLTPQKERGIKHKDSWRVKDPEAFLAAWKAQLGRTRPLVSSQDGDLRYVFTEKHRWGRLGVYVIHTALLLIMFGSMYTTANGIDGTVGIVEGQSNKFAFVRGPAGLRYRKDLGISLACTDFRLRQFVDGAPMDFESDLILYQDGKEMVRKTIQVNDPLEWGPYTFYQASYQPVPGDERVQLNIGKPGGTRTHFSVTVGTRIELPGTSTVYIPVEIIPEYANLGPALRVQEVKAGAPAQSFVVFQNYPDFDEQVRRGEFAVHYRGADKTYMTGIQVGSTPAISVVFFGFALMFVGMYIAFFMSHRRYWLRVNPLKDGTAEVTMAGSAKRHVHAFEEEYLGMVEALSAVAGVEKVAVRKRAASAS